MVAADGDGENRRHGPGRLQSAGVDRRGLARPRVAGELGGKRRVARTRVDSVGNLFVRRSGREDTLPAVMTGSHLDTQPTGGKFDGVYGVIAGLEVIDSLNDLEMTTEHPIEVVVWCNEEGCRFPQPMMGSAVWAGRTPLESAYALADASGKSVRQELERLGVATGTQVLRQPVKAALEVHIEQGPVLERCAQDHRDRHRGAAHEPARTHRRGTGSARGAHADGDAARSDSRARGSAAGVLRGGARSAPRMLASPSASSKPPRVRPTPFRAACASSSTCAIRSWRNIDRCAKRSIDWCAESLPASGAQGFDSLCLGSPRSRVRRPVHRGRAASARGRCN